jgi:hypothetical protein
MFVNVMFFVHKERRKIGIRWLFWVDGGRRRCGHFTVCSF